MRNKGHEIANNGWPSFARPATEDEIATMRMIERMQQRYETLSADVILLLAGLQAIEAYSDDARAVKQAHFALRDYEKARKEAEKKYRRTS